VLTCWGSEAAQVAQPAGRGRVWVLCLGRSPLWPQLAWALLACCFRSSAACCFSTTEDYRSSHLDVYCVQYSPRLKSVVEVPIMPKPIKFGHLSRSGFAQTVGSPWVWSTSYLLCGKQRCVWTASPFSSPHYLVVSLEADVFARRPSLLCVPRRF